MYRLVTSQSDSESQPKPRGVFATLALVLVLSLLGCAGLLVAGYSLPETAAKSYWFISRSSGVVAYGLVTLGVLWGLIQSGSLFRARVSPLLALGLHSYLNWLGLGLAGLHGLILLGDNYIKIDLAQIFTPFLADYRPIPVGLGIVGFYGMLLLTLSFYARSHLGQKNFRLLHYTSYAVFAVVTAHGVLAGTDSTPLWWLYSLSLVTVAAMTVLRIAGSRRARQKSAARERQPAAASANPYQG